MFPCRDIHIKLRLYSDGNLGNFAQLHFRQSSYNHEGARSYPKILLRRIILALQGILCCLQASSYIQEHPGKQVPRYKEYFHLVFQIHIIHKWFCNCNFEMHSLVDQKPYSHLIRVSISENKTITLQFPPDPKAV